MNIQNDSELIAILHSMDVPNKRKNISDASNVSWLLRNIAIRNSSHPQFKEAIELLKKKSEHEQP
jgi:hypothetical protein